MLHSLYPELNVRGRDIQTVNTQNPSLCGQVSCQSEQGTPTGLQVQQAVSQNATEYCSSATNTNTHGLLIK